MRRRNKRDTDALDRVVGKMQAAMDRATKAMKQVHAELSKIREPVDSNSLSNIDNDTAD